MPPRLVSLAILIYWSVAAFFLLRWEVLPEMTLGYPPDLRSIATAAGQDARPVTWSIDVIDDARKPEVRRTVGHVVTASQRLPDGWFELTSRVDFDAGEVLKRTPLMGTASVRLNIDGQYRVDPRGDLRWFVMKVHGADAGDDLVKVEGKLRDGVMEVTARGIAPILDRDLSFPYESRSVVYDALRPLDRLPGLQVGQRWDMQVVNPLSGRTEKVRAEVERRMILDWNGEAVSAFEVVHHSKLMTAKTWVRLDGVILRQQVPLPVVDMILERLPDGAPKPVADPAPGEGNP